MRVSAKVRGTWPAALCMAFAANATPVAPYVEVDGSVGIDTGYCAKNSTRCEIDYELKEARPSGATWYLFAGNPTFCAFLNNSGVGFGIYNDRWNIGNASGIANTPDLRLSAVVDVPRDSCYVICDGVTNATVSLKRTADYYDYQTVKLASNAQESGYYAKMRIYGCRIYESDELVHDFKPFLMDGVAGLMDSKTGRFITNGKKFHCISIGGDHAEFESPHVATPSGNDGVYVDTEYQASSNTCLMLDCALVDEFSGSSSWFLFEGAGSEFFSGFINPSTGYGTHTSGWQTGILGIDYAKIKDVRHTYVLDAVRVSASVVTAGATNGIKSVAACTEHNKTGRTIKIASQYNGSGAITPLRVYGCKIFEEGELVRDFVPSAIGPAQGGGAVFALKDSITGSFAVYPAITAEKCLSGYGKLASCPPYVETKRANSRYIDTGYAVTTATKVELDYSPAESRTSGDTWYLFAGGGSGNSSIFAAFINNSGLGFINTQNTWKQGVAAAFANVVDVRRTVVLDNPAGLASVITYGVTNATSATAVSGTFGGITLKISAPSSPTGNFATIRIFGCRIWEKEGGEYVLKRDYVPAVVNGVAGLQDVLPGGAFKAAGSASQLTYGGVFDVSAAQSAGKVAYKETATLTASAIGATSYRWLRNGEPIEGGEGGSLEVPWRRGGGTDLYRAVAVYAVGSGATMESEPSAEMAVENEPGGFAVFVR
ncbi:MAG: hypothetical protein IKE55_07240 [Kiritimatiellae bacterium]|nr:hypothetical protein [Kiritimatiellia bacterium]